LIARGASIVLGFLWKVPARSTGDLVAEILADVDRHVDVREAVRRTIVAQSSTTSPHIWASLVMIGAAPAIPGVVEPQGRS
jgi:CHAT domain-containing protein